ncbi:MAG: calcium/sodium antiporter [Bacteroidales bacterium]
MILSLLLLVIGLALLFASGKYLVDSSVALARILRIPTMIVGLTVVAFGTSAPELLVSLQAAFSGLPEIAMGNVVGSNLSNILLVLAITAVIYPIPVPASSVRHDWPVLMAVSLILFGFAFDGHLSRTEGLVFVLLLAAYLVFVVRMGRRNMRLAVSNAGENEPSSHREAEPSMKAWTAVLVLLVSVAGLAVGANLLVKHAALIAESLGVSQRVISLTMVAVGTSIPELTTSVIAALKKETDLSVGNILGSNIMNILAVLGFTVLVAPVDVDRAIARVDVPAMMGASFLLLLMMVPAARSRITRWEGIFMILIYLLYIYLIL